MMARARLLYYSSRARIVSSTIEHIWSDTTLSGVKSVVHFYIAVRLIKQFLILDFILDI